MTNVTNALNEVMEAVVAQMDMEKGLFGMVRVLDAHQKDKLNHPIAYLAIEETVSYLHTIQTGMLPVSYVLQDLKIEEMIQLILNLANKALVVNKLNIEHVWEEIEALFTTNERMVA